MRPGLSLPCGIAAILAPLVFACGTNASSTSPDAATTEAGTHLDAGPQPPDAETCNGDAGACLFGTAQIEGFEVTPTLLLAGIYRVFPSNGAQDVPTTFVAKDHSWAFDGLAPWA